MAATIKVQFPDGVRSVPARKRHASGSDATDCACQIVSEGYEPAPMEGWDFVPVFSDPKYAARPASK